MQGWDHVQNLRRFYEMKNRFSALAWMIPLLTLTAFSWSSAKLSEIKMSKDVEPEQKSPVDVAETFSTDAPQVYCTAKLSRAPSETSVKADFFYLEEGEQKIAELELPDLEGTRYVSFKLNRPQIGWPLGKYKAALSMNGKPQGETFFTLAGETAPAAQKPAAAPAATGYKTFSSPDYGFSIKYPATWFEGKRASDSIAFLYLANVQNNPVANINVQVIPVTVQDPAKQSKEAINLVAQQLIDQITSSEGSRVVNDAWTEAGSINGRELVFQYPYNQKSLKQRQFITFHNPNVYAVIYTAEEKVYEDFLPQYEKAVESLNFSER